MSSAFCLVEVLMGEVHTGHKEEFIMGQSEALTVERMNATQFVLSTTHGAAELNGGVMHLNLFGTGLEQTHAAYASAFDELMGADEFDLTFRIRPNAVHGESKTLNKEFDFMRRSRLLTGWIGDPFETYRTSNMPAEEIAKLPGSTATSEHLGGILLKELNLR